MDKSALTPREVARLLNYKEARVRQYLREGKIRGFKIKGSRLWRVTREEVDRIKAGSNGRH